MVNVKHKMLLYFGLLALSLTIMVIVLALFSPKPMIHGDYPYYADVKSITEESDVIVVGEVITARDVEYLKVNRTPGRENEETPYTLSTVKVSKVIKGNVSEGDVITIKQIGDYEEMPEEFLYKTDGYLKFNTTVLMFLKSYDQSPYSPLNPQQSIIEVKDNYLYSNSEYSLFGSSSKPSEKDTLLAAISEISEYVG